MKHLLLSMLLFVSTCAFADGQSCAFPDKPSKCCGAFTIVECPLNGCGGDPLLNMRKNITGLPVPGEVEDWNFKRHAQCRLPWAMEFRSGPFTAYELGRGYRAVCC